MTEWLINARDLPYHITQKSCWTLFWPFLPPEEKICSVVQSVVKSKSSAFMGKFHNVDIPGILVESSPGLVTACLKKNKRDLPFKSTGNDKYS